MPGFPWLAKNELDGELTRAQDACAARDRRAVHRTQEIAGAAAAVDGHTEMDALIAYLQGLKFHGEVAASKGQP